MPFELARYNVPNLAAIIALALLPLIALPIHRHGAATAQTAALQQAGQDDAAPVSVAHDIAD